MILSVNELLKFVHLEQQQIASLDTVLTSIGFEVESVTHTTDIPTNVVLGYIRKCEKHPNADKLNICTVFDGANEYQVVCGAQNVREGLYVAFAKIGAYLPAINLTIKQAQLRGVESQGMICSYRELGFAGDVENGIAELTENELGTDILNIFDLKRDTLIDISITPNRGDCFNIYGLARELGVYFQKPLQPLSKENIVNQSQISIKANCNVAFCHIKGIQNKISPPWIQESLKRFGYKTNNIVVDVLNYLMCVYGQPMHAYDINKINKNCLSIEYAQDNDIFVGLDGIKYILNNNILCVKSDDRNICIAGVMGSEDSKTDLNTNEILIESATFDMEDVRKSSTFLNCKSQSSIRFERGIDTEISNIVLQKAAEMIVSLCNGEIVDYIIHETKDRQKKTVKIDYNLINKITGCDVEQQFSQEILERLGFVFNNDEVIVPSWRHDVSISHDIVEEVMRFYQQANNPIFSESFSKMLINAKTNNEYDRIFKIKQKLTGHGYNEILSFSFIDSNFISLLTNNQNEDLYITHPISEQMNYMRPNLIYGLVKNLSENIKIDTKDLKIFEEGVCFHGAKDTEQEKHISGLIFGKFQNCILNNIEEASMMNAKIAVVTILSQFNISQQDITIKFTNSTQKYMHPLNIAEIYYNNVKIAQFGQLHPKFLSHFNIKQNVYFFETFIDKIPFKSNDKIYHETDCQPIIREFAFILKDSILYSDVEHFLSHNIEIPHYIDLLDVYQGSHIENGYKSIAIKIVLQPHTTLNGDFLDNFMTKIINSMKNQFDAKIRDGFVAN